MFVLLHLIASIWREKTETGNIVNINLINANPNILEHSDTNSLIDSYTLTDICNSTFLEK